MKVVGIRDFHFIIIGEYIYEALRKLINKTIEKWDNNQILGCMMSL